MNLSAFLSVSFGLLSLLLLTGVACSEDGSFVRRGVGRVLGFLMRRNLMLRGMHWLLTRRGMAPKVAYVVIALAWVWFVVVIMVAARSIATTSAGPPGPGFGSLPLIGMVFASLVGLFIVAVWALLATAFATAIVTFPLALASGLARRGGADKRFAVILGVASGTAGTALNVLAWSALP